VQENSLWLKISKEAQNKKCSIPTLLNLPFLFPFRMQRLTFFWACEAALKINLKRKKI